MTAFRPILILLALAGCSAAGSFPQEDISPDGALLASPRGADLVLSNAGSGTPVRRLSGGHQAPVVAVHFSADGGLLVSGDEEGKIALWNPRDGSLSGMLEGHRGAIRQFAARSVVPDLASGSDDGTIVLWDLRGARKIRELLGHAGPVYGLAFSPDGRTLASASADGTVRLWDVQTGGPRRILQGHRAAVRALDFDGSGTILASGSDDGVILIRELPSGRVLRTMAGSKGPVLNLYLSPDGRWILSYQSFVDPSSKELTRPISLWNVTTGDLDVPDYLFEEKIAPPDWPYREVFREIAARAAHQPR